MAGARFQTSACSAHAHPEISFVLAEPVAVPGIERTLLDYVEDLVQRGARLRPGQRVDLGGCLLRIFDRGDGTLGIRDVGFDGSDAEPESAHRSLMRCWLRQEVARSFGLEAEFPATQATAVVCSKLEESAHAILMKRMEPTPDTPDSGWFLGCTDEAHDHDAADNLLAEPLMALSERLPWIDQFVALPQGTDLVVEMAQRVRVPVLWHGDGGDAIDPLAGSYVAALNAAAAE